MKGRYWFIGWALTAWLMSVLAGRTAAPAVSNVTAGQRAHTKLVDITYDVSSPAGPLTVSLLITTNDSYGTNYDFTRYILPGTTITNLITNFTGNGYGTAAPHNNGIRTALKIKIPASSLNKKKAGLQLAELLFFAFMFPPVIDKKYGRFSGPGQILSCQTTPVAVDRLASITVSYPV